jgi:hypothetical protein
MDNIKNCSNCGFQAIYYGKKYCQAYGDCTDLDNQWIERENDDQPTEE